MTFALFSVFAAGFGAAIAYAWKASDAADDGDLLAFDRHTRRGWQAVTGGTIAGLAGLASLAGWLDEAAVVGIYVLGVVLIVASTVCIAAVALRAKGGAS